MKRKTSPRKNCEEFRREFRDTILSCRKNKAGVFARPLAQARGVGAGCSPALRLLRAFVAKRSLDVRTLPLWTIRLQTNAPPPALRLRYGRSSLKRSTGPFVLINLTVRQTAPPALRLRATGVRRSKVHWTFLFLSGSDGSTNRSSRPFAYATGVPVAQRGHWTFLFVRLWRFDKPPPPLSCHPPVLLFLQRASLIFSRKLSAISVS